MIGEINYNGVKSYQDLGFIIKNIVISNPSPRLILETVPFMNGAYDFTNVNGQTYYDNREINVTLKLKKYDESYKNINALYYNLINKFLSNSMGKLTLSWVEGYFIARITNISDFELMIKRREIEIKFIAQPFRKYENYESQIKWDDFCFERDVMQGYYNVTNSLEFKLINLNENTVKPVIECSSAMSLTQYFNDLSVEYSLSSGTNTNIIMLNKGENKFKVEGTGTIEFKWNREVI